MSTWTIYHNPRCGKSRQTLALLQEKLQEKDLDLKVIEYLKTPLSEKELREIARKLSKKVSEFIRTKEDVYKTLKLEKASESELLKAMAKNPILIERPIVIKNTKKGSKAVLGRPPENVLSLLE